MDRIEAAENSWAPSRRVFQRRVLLTAVITFSAMAAVALTFAVYFELPTTWAYLFALLLTLGFLVEDLMRWRNARADRWQIRDGHLLHEGAEGSAQIPLSEIVGVWTQFGSRVVVKLSSGQRVAIRYLPYPKATAAQIDAARPPAAPGS